MKRRLFNFSSDEQRTMLIDICNEIYVAKNKTFHQTDYLKALEKIDCLFRDGGYNKDYDNSEDN